MRNYSRYKMKEMISLWDQNSKIGVALSKDYLREKRK